MIAHLGLIGLGRAPYKYYTQPNQPKLESENIHRHPNHKHYFFVTNNFRNPDLIYKVDQKSKLLIIAKIGRLTSLAHPVYN